MKILKRRNVVITNRRGTLFHGNDGLGSATEKPPGIFVWVSAIGEHPVICSNDKGWDVLPVPEKPAVEDVNAGNVQLPEHSSSDKTKTALVSSPRLPDTINTTG